MQVFDATRAARHLLKARDRCGRSQVRAMERHLADLKREKDKAFPYRYDPVLGRQAINFFHNVLRHSKGEWAGTPLLLQPWEQFIVASIFGWVLKSDGTRRFRVVYIEVPRKNGKSTLAAGVALYLAFLDGEPGAEVYCAATKKDQARIVFDEAKKMVRASPLLRPLIDVLRLNLSSTETGSKLEPLSADANTLDGLNVHGAIIDEIHRHKSDDLIGVLQSASGSRRQPMRFEITTAGFDRTSVCWAHHDYSLKILDGTLADEEWFAFIAAAEDDEEWTAERTWWRANPNLGVSVKLDYLRAECERAKKIPTEQNTFRRMHLNQWTQQRTRFIDLRVWNAAPALRPEEARARQECFGGLDLANVLDLTAFALIWPWREKNAEGVEVEHIEARVRFWMPEEDIEEKERRDRVPYRMWAREGWLTLTPGNATDYAFIRQQINADRELYSVREIGYDRWNASQLVIQLQDDGATMAPFGQGYADMSPAVKQLSRFLAARTFAHGGSPVLNWMAANASTISDPQGNIKLDRRKATEKIDGLVAIVEAIGRWMKAEATKPTKSVYTSRGIRVI